MRILRRLLPLAALLVLAGQAGAAEKFPTKPITIVVPYAPGGATDIVARVIAAHMQTAFNQNVIVESKPGAFGILAMQEVARAAPNGYTLMVGNVSTGALTPVLFPKRMHMDYLKTIQPVTELGLLPGFLIGTTVNFPPRNAQDYVAYAKAHDGQVRYGSAGLGSYPQYDMEMFARKAGIHLVHVPAKGGASDILNALATGDIQTTFLNVATCAGMIKAGRMVPYAVTTDARLPDYPDVPTMAEIGYPGIGTNQWQALFVRAGTPPDIVDLLFHEAVEAMNSPQAKQVFGPIDLTVTTSASPAAAEDWLKGEMEHWRQVANQVHVDLED